MMEPTDMLSQLLLRETRDEDEEITMESSTDSLNFQYQSENKYNNLLPYADELDEEASNLLIDIKGQLGRSVMLRRVLPDCYIATLKLRIYLKIHNFRFSKEDHILFVKLMYELMTIPNLEPSMVFLFCGILNSLLKKRELISPSDLELPWRPLFDLMERINKRSANYRLLVGMERFIVTSKEFRFLIRQLKVFFPVTATQEILDELRPKLYPLDASTMDLAIITLEYFLPIKLAPENHVHGFKLWFDELMTIWNTYHNGAQWEEDLMFLMAKLAQHNIGYIDWEPYIPLMFTRFVRSLNLPVVYSKTKCSRQQRIDMQSAAVWIVSILGKNSSGQMHLMNFLKSIETYFHQANGGPWIEKLMDLLTRLAVEFISRLHRERYGKRTWKTPIPDDYKLTDDDVDAFVKCMMPPTMTAMFGRISVNSACRVFQRLATMRPNMVIPEVLERLYSTLDSLTEPHKLIAAMMAVTSVARPMVQGKRNINKGYTYNEGPSRVLPLLMSSLPGIDANDLNKSYVTFRLILVYAMVVPFIDCSKATASELLDEEDRLVCEETSQFEDFVLQFFDRIFSLIESSTLEYISNENQDGSGRSKSESMVEQSLMTVCTVLLVRTSDEIFRSALHKLRTFVTDRVLETRVSGPLAATLCHSFARVNGGETLRIMLPTVSQIILDALEDGDLDREERIDDKLLYPMLLLSKIVDTQGLYLMPHMNALMEILDKILHLKSREGSVMAGRILANIMRSLANISATHKFTYKGRDRNDPNYPYVLDWGQGANIDNLNINWYTPGEEEVSMMQYILTKYLPPELAKIHEYCTNENSEITRQELMTTLNIINAIIGGSIDYLPMPPEDSDDEFSLRNFVITIGTKGELRMPDGSNVRQYVVKIISELQATMLKKAEDDTKSFICVLNIWNILLLGECRMADRHRKAWMSWKQIKTELKDELVKRKRILPEYILERVELQHELRVYSRLYHLTNYHKFIMLQLFELATSRYATIRIGAQDSIFLALPFFPYSRTVFKSVLLDLMAKDPEEHHELHKGVLYLLLGPRHNPLISTRNWSFLRSIWPAIIALKPSEKMSVIQLKNRLAATVNRNLSAMGINLEVPDSVVSTATGLWNSSPKPLVARPTDREISDGAHQLQELSAKNRADYDTLLLDILSAIQTNCHWRQRLMGLKFIRDLAHLDRPYPPSVVEYCLGALVHESLEERKIATILTICMLRQQKRKYVKITIDVPEDKDKAESSNGSIISTQTFKPGVRPDNLWLQYNYETRPLTEEQWNESRYVRESHIGYYVWPKAIKVTAPSSMQPQIIGDPRNFTESEKLIDSFFAGSEIIDKIIKYNSIEERKGTDKFSINRYLLYKCIFRNHGIRHLELFIPHLRSLVTQKQESTQRCAAEIIAGIIKGSNHWSFETIVKMWDVLIPIIREALENVTTETLVDWKCCFAISLCGRDPNRHHWLIECLMEEQQSDSTTTSFAEVHRMYILQSALAQQAWRLSELMNRLSQRLERKLLANPFQNVRAALGTFLVVIFHADYDTGAFKSNSPTPCADELMNRLLPRVIKLGEDNIHCDENEQIISKRAHDISLFKTICMWMINTILLRSSGMLPCSSKLIYILCQLENYETDDELAKICTNTLAALSQALTLPRNINNMLDALWEVSNATSWSTRSSCLSFIEVFVFHNMGVIMSNDEWVKRIQEMVLRLIADERLEVREKAGRVLCGLLHCALLPKQEALLNEFKKKSKTKVKNNPDNLRLKHAGILGLCAFIQAHPYDVPKYVPSIFEDLNLSLNDPQPIPTTIRKTLGDFKRTHYDGWTTHAQCFTEEQLGILQDLAVPPSYYA
ncbi:hypothetical protein PV328_003071 [Microctonus aethiopoides]|uniref:Proteasome activator subunit 4 n=1 Tax=Microctonus aethiopoides TaxID=144406 RepID=A0AA39KK90_9HYME|nr:hypothetical protein PV328_003071 [Microctonus aethiopoides]